MSNEFKPDWNIEPLEMWDEDKLAELRGGNVALDDATEQIEKLQDRIDDLENLQADPENAEWGDVWVNKAEYEKLKNERDELLGMNRTLTEVAHSYEADLQDMTLQRDEATSAHQHLVARHEGARISWSDRMQRAQKRLAEILDEFQRYSDEEAPHAEPDFDYEAWAHANPPDPEELKPSRLRREEEE